MNYVYDNIEVQKTGRVATKTLSSGNTDTLHEIVPVDKMVGSWKKWVREVELFEITDPPCA